MAVLELNPISAKGKSLNLIKIASAYGKDTNPQGLINKSKIVYIEPNKKRTNNWLKLNRLQLPLVNQSGSKNSITKNNNTVNTNKLEKTDNDANLSIADEKSSWKPIKPSEKTQKVLDRLAKDKPVTLDLISELPEIAEAYARRGDINPTININTEERKQLRIDIQNEVENLGSARLDNNGEWVYNGNIARKSRIDIVIGLPAAGKSTVLANPLSETYQSRIVDSDVVKEKLPEYDNGYGADHVHEESKVINEQILKKAVTNGENIVLPIVGSKYIKLLNQIKDYKTQGYSVYLHLNKLPMNKSLGRMLNRFLTDGRFLDPTISYKYQNKPTEVFERIIKTKGELLDGYSEYSNDVERGEDPIFIRGTENIQEAYKRADKGITETNSGDVRESGRNRGLSNSQALSGKEEKKYSIASETEEKLKSLNEQNNGSDSGNSVDKQGESGVIKENITIPRSVGAAGKNYPVKLPGGNHTKFAEGTEITKIRVFAGKGTNTPIKDSIFLENEYGIKADEWQKVRGDAYIMENGIKRHVEVHWYEADDTRVEMKVKRYFDES